MCPFIRSDERPERTRGAGRRKAISLLVLASRTGKFQDGSTTYSLQQYSSTRSPLVFTELGGPLLGAIQFSFATNTEIAEARL